MSTKPRKTHLINFLNGREIIAPSITEFCRQVGLPKVSKFHITPVLDGVRTHHHGWCLPFWDKYKHKICDLHGKEYTLMEVFKIKDKYGLGIPSLIRLINGEISCYRGLFLKGTDPKIKIPARYEYELQKGKTVIRTRNLSALARMFHRKPNGNFRYLVYGRINSAYGYKIKKITKLLPRKNIL
jgi:hypothetical protein